MFRRIPAVATSATAAAATKCSRTPLTASALRSWT